MTVSGEAVGVAVGCLTIIRILVRGIAVPLHRAVNRLEKVEERTKELVPNSGSSIKDVVHDTGRDVQAIREVVEKNSKRLDDHAERLAHQEGKIEAIALVTSPTVLVDEGGPIHESRREGREG